MILKDKTGYESVIDHARGLRIDGEQCREGGRDLFKVVLSPGSEYAAAQERVCEKTRSGNFWVLYDAKKRKMLDGRIAVIAAAPLVFTPDSEYAYYCDETERGLSNAVAKIYSLPDMKERFSLVDNEYKMSKLTCTYDAERRSVIVEYYQAAQFQKKEFKLDSI